MRYPKPYKRKGLSYYYFSYRDPGTGKRRIQSTRCERAGDAHDFVRSFIDARTSRSGSAPFGEYSKPFFVPSTCPHVSRLRDKRQHIGLTHVTKCRQWLDRWVVPDKIFCALPINRITRGDLLELRDRLKVSVRDSKRIRGEGMNTVNKVMSAVHTVFSEACFRQHIPMNPADEIGEVGYDRDERDILSLEEIQKLFAEKWKKPLAQDVFRFAALTGMRCSEVLKMIPAEQLRGDVLTIDRAFKGKEEGRPKHEKTREIVLCADAVAIAGRHPAGFRYEDGRRLGETWWKQNFAKGLEEREVQPGDRVFTPHCLRHSLNTHLVEADVDPLRIQLYLWGVKVNDQEQQEHRRITPVQKIYTHLQAKMTEPVARKIEELYSAWEKKTAAQVAAALNVPGSG